MGGQCEAVGCTNHSMKKGTKVSFYRFPKNPDRRKRWANALKKLKRDGSEWTPLKNARICAEHFINGERALHFFEGKGIIDYHQLLVDHQESFQAGLPYPDSFYSSMCYGGKFHQVSEDTHWVPFLNASFTYIKETYPKPWNKTAQQLVAFIFGVVSHQVADVSWHSLGIEQGFLSTMGFVDFHGSFSDAHAAGDIGGDIVNAFQTANFDYETITWHVPVKDLVGIYKVLYGGKSLMDEQTIVSCTSLMFLARLGERIGIDKLFPKYAAQSPFLVDSLDEYFLGGQYDMAVWTTRIWNHVITVLDNGTSACSLPRSPLFITCDAERDLLNRYQGNPSPEMRNPGLGSPLDLRGLTKEDMILEQKGSHGIDLRPSTIFLDKMKKRRHLLSKTLKPESGAAVPQGLYSTAEAYSRLGRALVSIDVNHDQHLDLLISAPGYGSHGDPERGSVYIMYGTDTGLPKGNHSLDQANITLYGKSGEAGKFGQAMVFLDLNLDGYDDLVVSAPSVGSKSLQYQGEVYAFFGGQKNLSSVPNVTFTCKLLYCNLGNTLSVGDVNYDGMPDLLIGSPFAPGLTTSNPQQGFVAVILASSTIAQGDADVAQVAYKLLSPEATGVSHLCTNYSHFGEAVATVSYEQVTHLMVGSPSQRLTRSPGNCTASPSDIQQAGVVSTFSLSDWSSSLLNLTTPQNFSRLGSSFPHGITSTEADILIVGATGLGDSTSTQSGGVSVESAWKMIGQCQILGDRKFSRFGESILYISGDEVGRPVHYISAPLYTIDQSLELYGGMQGRVYFYRNLTDSENHSCKGKKPDAYLSLPEDRARFGAAIIEVLVVNGVDSPELAISSTHSSLGARLAGNVAIFKQFF